MYRYVIYKLNDKLTEIVVESRAPPSKTLYSINVMAQYYMYYIMAQAGIV